MSNQYRTIVLGAGASIAINTPGRVFACYDATAEFQLRVDNNAEIPISAKRVHGSSTSADFSRVFIRNSSGSTNTISYQISFQDIKIETSVSTITATITALGQNAATYCEGTVGPLVAATKIFTGLDGTNSRKSFSVWNDEADGSGNFIDVKGSNGVVGHRVAPQSSYVVESGELITLSAAGNYAYNVMEVFYGTP